MKKSKKLYMLLLSLIIGVNLLIPTEIVFATQNRMDRYSRNYTLTGDGAEDIVRVAMAQIGKNGSQLGYSEEWCADFVSDCAALANLGNVIPRDGYCPTLQTKIKTAGGTQVSINEVKKGDIVFYGVNGGSHVEIVYANNNGKISTIGGNSGSGANLYTRSVRDHSYQTMTITKAYRPNYELTPVIFPGTIDISWNVPTNVTASYRISTYDQYGNVESNRYIEAGDYCYITEVYTNGFVKIQYPTASGARWSYAKASDFSLSKKASAILPGTIDSSWEVPINVTASYRISTYDQYGNVESNRYIEVGDYCYITEVYTNGFVKIQYPTASGVRWSYAKVSDFSLSKKNVNQNNTTSNDKYDQVTSNEELPVDDTQDSLDNFEWPDNGEDSVEDDENIEDILRVGDEIETDDAIYTITQMDDEYCVEYSELFDEELKKVVIPSSVMLDGVAYKVTSIGEKAFYKNTSLERVAIGKNVREIGAKAFYGCKFLKQIVISSTKLKTGMIGSKAFKKINKSVKVYVPSSKYKAYKKMLKKAGIGTKVKIYKTNNL